MIPKMSKYEMETGLMVYRPTELCKCARTNATVDFALQGAVGATTISPLTMVRTLSASVGLSLGETADVNTVLRVGADLDLNRYDLMADMHRSVCFFPGCRRILMLSGKFRAS